MQRSPHTLKPALLTLAAMGLVACQPMASAPVDSGSAPATETIMQTPQMTVTVAVAPEPAPRPSAARLHLPSGCSAEESSTALVVHCPDGGLQVRWDQRPPSEERLEDWTRETMVQLKSQGVPLVLLGEPTCTVQDEPVACTRVLGRSADGIEDTRFLAVGASPDGGSVEVSCHWGKRADESTYQGLCQQVLRRI